MTSETRKKWIALAPSMVLSVAFFIGMFLLFQHWQAEDRTKAAAQAQKNYELSQKRRVAHETGQLSSHSYGCTQDCSGHDAGYDWAQENEISSVDECGGDSDSFIEGCVAWVEENR